VGREGWWGDKPEGKLHCSEKKRIISKARGKRQLSHVEKKRRRIVLLDFSRVGGTWIDWGGRISRKPRKRK